MRSQSDAGAPGTSERTDAAIATSTSLLSQLFRSQAGKFGVLDDKAMLSRELRREKRRIWSWSTGCTIVLSMELRL